MGTQRAGDWTPREQAVFRAVGRSLTLALERTEQARLLTEQHDVLDDRSRELETINVELEALTYAASHDLRTPVRHVMRILVRTFALVCRGRGFTRPVWR